MIKNYILLFCLSFLFTLAAAQKKSTTADNRPNIIFILTDDQPYDYIGALGDNLTKTPNLDKLIKEGVLFTNYHVTSTICTPSRASMLLGVFERTHNVNFNSGTSVDMEAWNTAYPMVLRENGYYTGYVGKNHVPIGDGGYESGVMEKSFDFWYGGHDHLGFYPKTRHAIFNDAKSNTQVEILEEGVMDFLDNNQYHLKNALHFLSSRPSEKPFNLTISFNLPHDGGTSAMKMLPEDPEIYKTLYRDVEIPLEKNYVAKKDIKNPKLPVSVHHVRDRQDIYNYVDTPESVRERTIRKMQALTGIDQMVGQIRKKLSELKIEKNTILIFTSDHGLLMGQFGLGGKALNYEICTKVPLIIYNPLLSKNMQGKKYDMLVQSIDMAPTMLKFANVPAPASYQGKDISGILNGKENKVRDYLFTENLWSTFFGNPRIETVQDQEWKYLRYYKNDNPSFRYAMQVGKELGITKLPFLVHDEGIALYRSYVEAPMNGEKAVYEELFHLTDDPDETTNLALDTRYTSQLDNLRSVCDKMVKEARGTGKPRVLRYTVESREEKKGGKQGETND